MLITFFAMVVGVVTFTPFFGIGMAFIGGMFLAAIGIYMSNNAIG